MMSSSDLLSCDCTDITYGRNSVYSCMLIKVLLEPERELLLAY